MNLREKQLQHELESDAEAAAARLKELRQAAANGDVNLPKTSRFIARAYASVRDSLELESLQVRRGRGAKYGKWLKTLNFDVAAVLALRECIGQLSGEKIRERPVTLQVLAGAIGRLYELEIRIAEAATVNPVYMKKIHAQVKERGTTSKHHLQGVYGFAYKQVMKEFADTKLNAVETVQLGRFGLQACIDAELVVLVKSSSKAGKMFFYELAPEIEGFLTDYSNEDVQSVRDVHAGAMMCPPDPWDSLLGGGFLSARRKQHAPLMSLHGIRKSERRRLRDAFTAENMPKVFGCANYLQSIPLALHRPTHEAIQRLWADGGGAMGVPGRSLPKKPVLGLPAEWAKADGTADELEMFYQWKRDATAWYGTAKEWRGKVRELGGFLKTAQKIEGPMWLPVFCDTRGRWYYRSSPNPQGSDLAKSVIHFANKKKLGRRGLFWLKVAVANNFGFDKVRFKDRAAWTDENWERIVQALDCPENNEAVWGKDGPWTMYAAAYELRQALSLPDPEQYECGVPVHMDATCSGLQHFSAILRDPTGGLYVNLFENDPLFVGPKSDVYGKVGHETSKVVILDLASEDAVVRAYAEFWHAVGISRSLAKTPVMTYCYGATLRGTSEFVQAFIEKELGSDCWPDCWPEEMSGYLCSMYLAKKIFEGIEATVPAAAELMRWLKQVARDVPRGTRMEFQSPTGFLVQHDYQGFDETRVKLNSCGITQVIVRDFNDDTLPIPMQNAIAPNFVHSLDAAHLTLVALAMQKLGLEMIAIHDSFATHPCDVDEMHRVIREVFYEMYSTNSVLMDFLWSVQATAELPVIGSLDLSLVLSSEFFFC